MRIILNKHDRRTFSTIQLHEIANIETIEARAEIINNKYYNHNIATHNPLVIKMIYEINIFEQTTFNRPHISQNINHFTEITSN
jgi:hypothetical protein